MDNNEETRPIAALARELGISERQFHRRLKVRDPAACMKLREEVVFVHGCNLTNLANEMREAADLLRKCDPDVARGLEIVAAQVEKVAATEMSAWRKEHGDRMDALLYHEDVSDDAWKAWFYDATKLPPTPAEVRERLAPAGSQAICSL